MSIKKLFDSTDKTNNYLSDTTEKEAFSSVESSKNTQVLKSKQDAFVPQVDYSDPAKFARYGSAYLYYKSAIERVHDYYPYDGTSAEINAFYNKSLEIEKYIFNKRYPRTNGYAIISADGYGTATSTTNGYGYTSNDLEYISFFGGPTTASAVTSLKDAFPTSKNEKFQQGNVYDTDIYTSEGLPTDYGSGTRQSNLKSNFDTGITVEFWLKTGSLSPGNSTTHKQIVFDAWNNESSASADYGRITITMTGSGLWTDSPFYMTVMSGAAPSTSTPKPELPFINTGGKGIHLQKVGSGLVADGNWHHYAFALYNSGSDFRCNFYLDGKLNQMKKFTDAEINELNSKKMLARIGALTTAPAYSNAATGSAKLSGSMDEFRFWKAKRNSEEIGRNWFAPIYGGTNTDVSNAALGVYYKFNEGITTTASFDNIVLDYSGRLTNGTWTGYGSNSRNTGSAIVEASASATEYQDPIIYSEHPDVISLKAELLDLGTNHDINNNAAFSTLIPHWVHEEEDDSATSQTKLMSHIVGTYFDKLYLQIAAVSRFKRPTYTSASHVPYSFAQHLPQSLGLYSPELYIDADVMEKFTNREDSSLFEGDLTETKNLIYLNLYNNLTSIYKSKGTERAIKNVFRCFNIDDKLVRLNVYSNNQTYELENNLRQTLINKKSLNFNNIHNTGALVYLAQSGSEGNTTNYISGSHSARYENKYGFTLETDITFPSFNKRLDKIDRNELSASLFGMCSASINSDVGTTRPSTDYANFEVYAIRDIPGSKNVYFRLTSSVAPKTFPDLTSSIFYNVYDNDRWNISVRLKPSNYPLTDTISGSSDYTYDLEFRGVNTLLGEIQDSFFLTASVSKALGQSMLQSDKRIFVGAHRTNVTGAVICPTDVYAAGIKYWDKYLENNDLNQHAVDVDNVGISGSYQHLSSFESVNEHYDLLNANTLILDWNFNNVTSSNAAGNFHVQDLSSGSALIRNNYGWFGNLAGYQHTGYGYGFGTSSSDVIRREKINAFQFIDPESPISSNMVKILSEDDRILGITDNVPSFYYTVEKSMYNAISEEMLDFFAGAVDFNNLIGDPVNRYRSRYKGMEKLREAFFRRVTQVSDVEKYITYYKWFDDAVSEIISQLLPASSEFIEDTLNTVESHVLERNKYQTKFPTMEYAYWRLIPDPSWGGVEATGYPMLGIEEKTYNWRLNHHPVSNLERVNSQWWKERANPVYEHVISSSNLCVNYQRENIRWNKENENYQSASLGGYVVNNITYAYTQPLHVLRNKAKPYELEEVVRTQTIKGGVNFTNNKNIHFTYNALAPAGPVNKDTSESTDSFIPLNVLLAFTDDTSELKDSADVTDPNKKVKKYFQVQHGRDWGGALSYSNVKSSYAFPFNIFSSSVSGGYNDHVNTRATGNIIITNLHNDVYGPEMEVPMQGAFTNYAVGGHQSRHIALNTGSDNSYNRPEAWKLLLGQCLGADAISGAIGMVGADYPWPEANEVGGIPYPMTGAHKAVYYRDHVAKRPVNIRNIQHKTSSKLTVLGNYNHVYEIVSTVGAWQNPRHFVDEQPSLPAEITQTPSASQARSILDIHRNASDRVLVVGGIPIAAAADRHFEFVPSYSVGYRTSSANKSVITSRFSAPGGIEVMGGGYTDYRANEFSVYNAFNYRNLTVIKPSQGPSGSYSESGSTAGTPGIKVYDIHGKDYGLRSHLSRHAGRFGRDSLHVADPGASYDQLPAFHKVNRNRQPYLVDNLQGTVTTSSQYDNFWVTHQIPRNDRQYAWVTNSLAIHSTDVRYYGYAPSVGITEGMYSSSTTGWTAFFNYVSGSDVASPKDRGGAAEKEMLANTYQSTVPLNIWTEDPVGLYAVTDLSNSLGWALDGDVKRYVNDSLISKLGIAAQITRDVDYFNLIMTRRGGTFGWNWKSARRADHPILRKHYRENIISIRDGSDRKIKNWKMPVVSTRASPAYVNVDVIVGKDVENVTFKSSYGNKDIFFNSCDLNDLIYGSAIPNQAASAFEQIVGLADSSDKYQLNWILYSEQLFPKLENEWTSSAITRPSYDNEMWRHSAEERVNVGSATVITNSFGTSVSQSCWPLDPPQGFLTRSAISQIGAANIGQVTIEQLQYSQSAGELQNCYFHIAEGSKARLAGNLNATRNMQASALYARKHCLPSPQSVVSPSGIPIAQTGSNRHITNNTIDKFGGEAAWEAPTQAGIIIKDGKTGKFVASASQPWFNEYEFNNGAKGFKDELSVIAKDYAIVPEFRISEHIEDFTKYGTTNMRINDIFEIPHSKKLGKELNSSTASFYKDYSNSDFMRAFIEVNTLSDLDPTQIKLSCKAVIRFNPYKGFYPAQRTIDLVKQFSSSYGKSLASETSFGGSLQINRNKDGSLRPFMQTMFSPGILFNSIKSGLAVDYPIVTDPTRIRTASFGSGSWAGTPSRWSTSSAPFGAGDPLPNWMLTNNDGAVMTEEKGYLGGPYFKRIPFEAIIEPEKYVNGYKFFDVEADPSASLTNPLGAGLTASFNASATDTIYSKMASNFFGEVGKFFLKDSNYTKLESGIVIGDQRFKENSVYMSRLKIGRSTIGARTYQFESGATGNNTPYSTWGGKQIKNGIFQNETGHPLPQDPRQNVDFRETFTMYSRPTAFGPPIAGRPTGSLGITSSIVTASSPMDSMAGFNWAYTPPYYNGEAWIDFIFRPTKEVTYDLERILAETETVFWRVDPGPIHPAAIGGKPTGTQLVSTFSSSIVGCGDLIYEGKNINNNAMQLSASLNYLGIERVERETKNLAGKVISSENETVGMKWIIQPKWETPMLNFNNRGLHPITVGANNITMPDFAAKSTPRGMWHQFGVIPETPDVGVFLQLEAIPEEWLQYHYNVVQTASIYNGNSLIGATTLHKRVKPLTDVVNFDNKNSKVRLGELAEKRTIKEAVVAVPYIIEASTTEESLTGIQATDRKSFFSIPVERIEACYEESVNTVDGDSYASAGESIRRLVQKMQRYVLPPQFDFISNTSIDPIVMYIFEFEYTLDRDDLSYIWQNLAPRGYKDITLDIQSTAHDLLDNELMAPEDILDNNNLRWMVFKIKQRSQAEYSDYIISQAGQSSTSTKSTKSTSNKKDSDTSRTTKGTLPSEETDGYNIQFNWPYDYLSLVELVKFDVEVLYGTDSTVEDYAEEVLQDENATAKDKMEAQKVIEEQQTKKEEERQEQRGTIDCPPEGISVTTGQTGGGGQGGTGGQGGGGSAGGGSAGGY